MPTSTARPRTIGRIRAAVDLLRPRTLFRTLARVDSVVDDVRALKSQVDQLTIRIEQLTAIQRLNWEQADDQAQLDALDAARIGQHIDAAVRTASMELEPFPHTVITNWLPSDVYDIVIRAVPPPVFFADREERRQRLIVPFDLAPAFSQSVWRFVSQEVIGGSLCRALNEKFAPVIRTYISTFCPQLPLDIDLTLHASDGRIMLRRPGYVIEPHRDPKWGFLTGLVYLVRKGDNEAYGTQLYRVRDDVEAPSGKPHYVDRSRCELVKSIPFRPNTLLVFLNSTGAHGASIPSDAVPADLTRLVYQFRLGPSEHAMQQLLSHMPPENRSAWAGSKMDRVGTYD